MRSFATRRILTGGVPLMVFLFLCLPWSRRAYDVAEGAAVLACPPGRCLASAHDD
ncbi:hypothetical protein GCM10010371_52900 [Streptomyces subrutilus]|uniref:Uncharacterized protein n=1 Tax=Streptomyces subrutilus TaxID=36818 RepID=A0A918R5A1_9ACTN|nr:hypothetical protein GCM10010371_52900 [Streptomyces subrutilus]